MGQLDARYSSLLQEKRSDALKAGYVLVAPDPEIPGRYPAHRRNSTGF
jgi:hypothetical protein